MRVRIDDAESDLVAQCFAAGESLNSLSARLRRDKRTLRRVLVARGIDPATDRPAARVARLKAFQLICRYRGGEKQVDLAKEFGVSQPAIHYAIAYYSQAYDAAYEVSDVL